MLATVNISAEKYFHSLEFQGVPVRPIFLEKVGFHNFSKGVIYYTAPII
jgi:hypothetical protein